MFENTQETFKVNSAVIKVVGVGGGGGNAINSMIESNVSSAKFIAVNTDSQALLRSKADERIQIGDKLTKGLGAGSDPSIGEAAAEESKEEISAMLDGTDLLFIAAGMGGGTGTGAAPIVAQIARELEILTIAVVTKPFLFEGKRRMQQAEVGIEKLSENVDALIVIPNERLKLLTDKKITFLNAFQEADDVLRKGVQSICELITVEGIINLDFADVSAVMANAGLAHMGVGAAKGKDKAEQAAKMAMSSPLLETNISGAKGIVVQITGSPDIGLDEIDSAVAMITSEAQPDANIIFGAALDPTLEDEMRITLIATGFDADKKGADVRRQMAQAEAASKAATEEAPKETGSDIDDILSMLNKR